jgi:hypothetical protein
VLFGLTPGAANLPRAVGAVGGLLLVFPLAAGFAQLTELRKPRNQSVMMKPHVKGDDVGGWI